MKQFQVNTSYNYKKLLCNLCNNLELGARDGRTEGGKEAEEDDAEEGERQRQGVTAKGGGEIKKHSTKLSQCLTRLIVQTAHQM